MSKGSRRIREKAFQANETKAKKSSECVRGTLGPSVLLESKIEGMEQTLEGYL